MNAGRARKPIGDSPASPHTACRHFGARGSTVRWLCQSASVAFAQITHERGLTDETVPWFALGDGGCGRSPARGFRCSTAGRRGFVRVSCVHIAADRDEGPADHRQHRCTQQPPLAASPTAIGPTRSAVRACLTLSRDELRQPLAACALPALSSTSADGTQVANYEGVVVAVSGDCGPEHRSVGHAADLRAPVLGSPGDRLCGPEQRLRDEPPIRR